MSTKPAYKIWLHHVSKEFSSREVIKNLDVQISEACFVSLVGPSGCGKSTLLRLIAGLESPTQGSIEIQSAGTQSMGIVFQEAQLLHWRTALENVLLPLEIHVAFKGLTKDQRHQRAWDALKKVQLTEFAHLFPHELSGGMKMRVAIARALVMNPDILLLDEPFAALDEFTRLELQIELRNIWQKENITIIFVTHSLSEAVFLSERIIMLKGSGAKVILDQKIDLPSDRPESLKTSESFNLILRDLSERLR